MSTTQDTIRDWLRRAKEDNCTHMLVVCDTFDYNDYPVFCESKEECLEQHKEHHLKNMQRVMEVYDLSIDIESQLKEVRAKHLPK